MSFARATRLVTTHISLRATRLVTTHTSLRSMTCRVNKNRNTKTALINRPNGADMERALQLPPPLDFLGLGAWVEHVAAPREELVSVLVQEYLDLPPHIISKLLEFGAIYTSPLIPEIPDVMLEKISEEKAEEMRHRRNLVLENAPMEVRQAHPQRLMKDVSVEEHSYIRIHMSPKRFPIFHTVHWPDKIMEHGADYVVLNKPPYLPTAPTVDNILESALAGASKGIGAEEPLLITSRLDQATSGVLVLGKTTEFVQKFNLVIRGEPGQYKKLYRALVDVPPPIGHMTHHVRARYRRQGTPYFTLVLRDECAGQPKAQFCELIVHSVEKVPLGRTAQELFGEERKEAYEVVIELVTGRTHQIRAQLSAVGCPLLGDDLYQPLSSSTLRNRFEDYDPTIEISTADGHRLLAEADGPIGLQSYRMEVADGSLFGREEGECVVFDAGPPFWRD